MKIDSEQIKTILQGIKKESEEKSSAVKAEAQTRVKVSRTTGRDTYTQADYERDQFEIRFNNSLAKVCSSVVRMIEAMESEAEAIKAEKLAAKEAKAVEKVVKESVEPTTPAKSKRKYVKHKAPAEKSES